MIDRLSSSNYTPQIKTNGMEEIKPSNEQEEVSLGVINTKEKEESEFITFPKEKIEEVIQGMNKFLEPTHTSLKFQFHEKLNEYYVSIVDDKTKEIIREIPSKKLLDMYAAMTEFLGLIVDKKI
jgi:flagellar protein FlaG